MTATARKPAVILCLLFEDVIEQFARYTRLGEFIAYACGSWRAGQQRFKLVFVGRPLFVGSAVSDQDQGVGFGVSGVLNCGINSCFPGCAAHESKRAEVAIVIGIEAPLATEGNLRLRGVAHLE